MKTVHEDAWMGRPGGDGRGNDGLGAEGAMAGLPREPRGPGLSLPEPHHQPAAQRQAAQVQRASPTSPTGTTPLDPAGRWLCLDRTKKSGLYDRVYFDTTGNGRLDDKTPVGTSRTATNTAPTFEPVRVVFKGEDGPITYHLVLRFMQV